MKKKHVYLIEGSPDIWQRAGVGHRFGKTVFYDNQRTTKLHLGIIIDSQNDNDFKMLEGPLLTSFKFYFKIPKTREKILKEESPHCFRPDIDNAIKVLLDTCTGILYKDDSQIFKIVSAEKLYSKNPRTEFIIWEK